MKTHVLSRAIDLKAVFGAIGRRSASAAVGMATPVINMGLEEIQKQAKAS